jgi:hypothetical protein
MLLFFLFVNLKGTWLLGKLFWLILAYALAARGYVASTSPIRLTARSIAYRKTGEAA